VQVKKLVEKKGYRHLNMFMASWVSVFA